MSVIHILPEHVANKIAAGEVIERPSSIVKELIENALDAGAASLEVEIQHGGRSLIRVTDDGCGMSSEDAELAFKRHATSKISEASDLFAIGSFGFRGEALPSMAAVARVRLITREPEKPAGTEIAVEGGKLTEARECACAPGTTVEVRDLFFNTPARRKFLRAESTEQGHIMDVISHFALARPDLRILFRSSGRVVLDLMPAPELLARAEGVFGRDAVKHFLPVAEDAAGLRVHGLIGKPFAARANRSGQIFFVNGRWVRFVSLSHALQAGYHGLLMHGQYPVAVIFIEVDPERVDVNVHPTKQEVRLSNESEIKSLLKKAVAGKLREAPDISPELKAFLPNVGPSRSSPATAFPSLPGEAAQGGLLSAAEAAEPAWKPSVLPAAFRPAPQEAPLIEIRNQLQITKILGQIHGTFIIAETEDGLMIADQHAAHERIMFEVLVKNFESGQAAKQNLLMDEILELHPRETAMIRDNIGLLEKIGFEIEEFGENAFVVRAYPAVLEHENPVAVLKRFVEEKEDGQLDTKLESHHEEIAALIACKRQSVKAHDPLGPLQLEALLGRLAQCQNPFSCPHGRPVFFKKSFSELEKQFKRK